MSSPEDFNAVSAIASQIKGPVICGLARAVPHDIEVCANALKSAEQSRIHTFLATSPIHLEHKLKLSTEQALEKTVMAVRTARHFSDDVEFSCEDAGRTPVDTLCRFVETAIHHGASTINLPDTVGYTTPDEWQFIIQFLMNNVPNIDKARLSIHCHNDLGLAVANSLAAINAGVRQVECTVNGIGERAGNCALEEIAMVVESRRDILPFSTNIEHQEIARTSRLVSQLCHMPVQANKAIVGEAAFSHSSGIHQDGVLKQKQTYEIISPEAVGFASNQLNMTSRSGRHVIKSRLAGLGYEEGDYNLEKIYQDFVQLADEKGNIYDYDLEALVLLNGLENFAEQHFQLDYFNVSTSAGHVATATVSLRCNGVEHHEASTGSGPVEAAYKAIERVTGEMVEIIDYTIQSTGQGVNTQGKVSLVVSRDGQQFHGSGLAQDIVEASILAFVNALNVIKRHEQVNEKKCHQSMKQGAA